MTSVLYVCQPTVAGVAQCVYDWTVGLADRGWQVSLACPSDGWLAEQCRDAGIATYVWETHHAPHVGVPAGLRDLKPILAQVAPEVVHLNGAKAGVVGRLALRGRTPTAFSPHSWAFEAAQGAKSAAALQWERLATRWTDVIISVSEAEAELGRQRGISARYVIAPNGIDTDDIAPAADRSDSRRELGIAPDRQAVVCVGRMHRQKGQDVLLAAWREVAEPDRRTLYLVGDGPMREVWQDGDHGSDVVFVGDVDRAGALAWMRAADVVVVPSRWEGMALVPLESLSVGTPVVASDVTGVREAVGPGCGAVVPPEDPSRLAAALDTWLRRTETEQTESRSTARRWAVEHFDVARTVGIIDETLHGLVRPTTRGPRR